MPRPGPATACQDCSPDPALEAKAVERQSLEGNAVLEEILGE